MFLLHCISFTSSGQRNIRLCVWRIASFTMVMFLAYKGQVCTYPRRSVVCMHLNTVYPGCFS